MSNDIKTDLTRVKNIACTTTDDELITSRLAYLDINESIEFTGGKTVINNLGKFRKAFTTMISIKSNIASRLCLKNLLSPCKVVLFIQESKSLSSASEIIHAAGYEVLTLTKYTRYNACNTVLNLFAEDNDEYRVLLIDDPTALDGIDSNGSRYPGNIKAYIIPGTDYPRLVDTIDKLRKLGDRSRIDVSITYLQGLTEEMNMLSSIWERRFNGLETLDWIEYAREIEHVDML